MLLPKCFRPHQGIILFNLIDEGYVERIKIKGSVSVPIRGLFYLTTQRAMKYTFSKLRLVSVPIRGLFYLT